jgi:hypothetical protein
MSCHAGTTLAFIGVLLLILMALLRPVDASWHTIPESTLVNINQSLEARSSNARKGIVADVERFCRSVRVGPDCFKGVNLRRTEVVRMVWAIQNLCGNLYDLLDPLLRAGRVWPRAPSPCPWFSTR